MDMDNLDSGGGTVVLTLTEPAVEARSASALVHAALAARPDLSSPYEISDYVLSQMDARVREAALRVAFPHYVRLLIQRERMRPIAGEESVHSRRESHGGSDASSPRWRAVRASVFAQRVCPGGEWKSLGDCSPEDVLLLVDERTEHARRVVAVAKKYKRLHRLMASRGVAIVSELAESEVEEILR